MREVRLHDGRHCRDAVAVRGWSWELLCQAQMRTTTDTYSHVLRALAREAAEPMGKTLWG